MKQKIYFKFFLCVFSILVFTLCGVSLTSASDLSSTNFIIRDPLIGTGGGYYSSGSFKLLGSGDGALTGYNSSLSFIGEYGFLYFPFINSGTLSASVSTNTVNLSWTASTAGRGFAVSGYNVGKATTSGGPYTFTPVGNVLSYAYTSQPNGTYYFVLQTLDGAGFVNATSNEVTATVSSVVTPPLGGGGGGMPVIPIVGTCGKIADFNCDGVVDILDLSILLYYTDMAGEDIKPFDLSADGKIDLEDISILFYYWNL